MRTSSSADSQASGAGPEDDLPWRRGDASCAGGRADNHSSIHEEEAMRPSEPGGRGQLPGSAHLCVVQLKGSQSAPHAQDPWQAAQDRHHPLTGFSSQPALDPARDSVAAETSGTALRMRACSRGFRGSSASEHPPRTEPTHSPRLPPLPPPGAATWWAPSSLVKHLRPAPLVLCFVIGLGAGLLLPHEPQGNAQSSPSFSFLVGGLQEKVHTASTDDVAGALSRLTSEVELHQKGTRRSSKAAPPKSTRGEGEGHDHKGAREPWEMGGTPRAADPLPLRSPEEELLRSLGTPALGLCQPYHHVNVHSLQAGVARDDDTAAGWPLLLVVTPTYVRPFQAMFLTRLANTLRQVPPPLLWIVVEIGRQSQETAVLLRQSGLPTRHIVSTVELADLKDRGVNQRNAALAHIEEHRLQGVVFFADDDNVYSPALLYQIRSVRRLGVWPVGMLQEGKGRANVEGPVCEGHTVQGWHTNEKSKRLRRFHVDMCGFAFNSSLLWDPTSWGVPSSAPIRQLDTVKEGFQETTFIEQLVPDEGAMEGLANECRDVLVWHLHSEAQRTSPFPRLGAPASLQPVISARRGNLG